MKISYMVKWNLFIYENFRHRNTRKYNILKFNILNLIYEMNVQHIETK